MDQTFGQKRVKADFNPDKNETVDQIKNKSAELIDLIDSMAISDCTGERLRLLKLSTDQIEIACMLAVKANFTK